MPLGCLACGTPGGIRFGVRHVGRPNGGSVVSDQLQLLVATFPHVPHCFVQSFVEGSPKTSGDCGSMFFHVCSAVLMTSLFSPLSPALLVSNISALCMSDVDDMASHMLTRASQSKAHFAALASPPFFAEVTVTQATDRQRANVLVEFAHFAPEQQKDWNHMFGRYRFATCRNPCL